MKKEVYKNSYWLVVLGAILFGTITVGGQFFINLGLSAYEIAIFSMSIASLILFLIILIKPEYRIKKQMILFFVIFGLANSIQEWTQFGAISLGTPVAIVALLLYSQPIWTTIFGRFFLKEKITKKKIFAVIIAIIGVIILIDIRNINSTGRIRGIILALLGGVFLSLWVILGKKSGIEKQHFITTAFGGFLFSFLWLVISWPIIAFFIHDTSITRISFNFPIHYWIYFLIFTLLSAILPSMFFYKGVQKVEASTAGIILLLEPISATILAILFFNQLITTNIFISGILIIFSNYLVISEKK